jgi:hypothetical protein
VFQIDAGSERKPYHFENEGEGCLIYREVSASSQETSSHACREWLPITFPAAGLKDVAFMSSLPVVLTSSCGLEVRGEGKGTSLS